MKYRNDNVRKPQATQSGVAAIWLALSLVPVMGMTFFAVEGTRYIQETSRLRDGAQAAALAVTIEDKENLADAMAQKYISDYVRDIKSLTVTTLRGYEAPTEANGNVEKIQYDVDATTTHDSWFSSSLIPSFKTTENLVGRAVAIKYPAYLGDQILDVVLVTDFSGSMNNDWSGSDNTSKIQSLKLAVKDLSEKILVPRQGETEILNRIAVVPFNLRVQDKISGVLWSGSQLRYDNSYRSGTSDYTYEEINWSDWSTRSYGDVQDCADKASDCFSSSRQQRRQEKQQAKRIVHVLEQLDDGKRLEIPSYIDYSKSVNDMFENKQDHHHFHFKSSTNKLYNTAMTQTYQGGHYVIPLTNELTTIQSVQSMTSNGNTAAYQGILRGLQVLADGHPGASATAEEIEDYEDRLKMLIVLSDGKEYPYTEILPGLVDEGLCDVARSHFATENGSLFIGVIGVDFEASAQSGFQDCVENEDEDIIDVSDREDLIKTIEDLIRKGSRGSAVSRLYG